MARHARRAPGNRIPDAIAIGVLAKTFPPELVDEIVDAAGVRERRLRALPSWLVVYFLLAMVLFSPAGYGEVWGRLVSALRWTGHARASAVSQSPPSAAAISYARQRVGWTVVELLLDAVAGAAASPRSGNAEAAVGLGGGTASMRLVAVDTLRVCMPGTSRNIADFGRAGDGGGTGAPQARLAAVYDCETGSLYGATVSPAATEPGVQGSELLRKLVRHRSGGTVLLAGEEFDSSGQHDEARAAGLRILEPDALSERQAVLARWSRHRFRASLAGLGSAVPPREADLMLRSESPPMIRQEIYAMLCCYQATVPLAPAP